MSNFEDFTDVENALDNIRRIYEKPLKTYNIRNIQDVYNEIIDLFELRNVDLEYVKERIKEKLGNKLKIERDFLIRMVDLYGFYNEFNNLKIEYDRLKEILQERIKKEEELYIQSSFNKQDKISRELKIKMEEDNKHLERIMKKLEILEDFKRIEKLDEIKRLINEFKRLTEPTKRTTSKRSFRYSRRIDIEDRLGGKKSKNRLIKKEKI